MPVTVLRMDDTKVNIMVVFTLKTVGSYEEPKHSPSTLCCLLVVLFIVIVIIITISIIIQMKKIQVRQAIISVTTQKRKRESHTS